jgi:heptosyltransferase-2
MSARVLICGLNWIGDSLMAFPAVAALRQREPASALSVLVKPGLAALWRLHPAGLDVLSYEASHRGTFAQGRALRAAGFTRCHVLPNSFRSAWLPFLAGIPERIGRATGPLRDALLTRRLPHRPDDRRHQQFEYFDLLAPEAAASPAPPHLALPAEATAAAEQLLGGRPGPLIGLLPGAARGPAKRWPAEHFIAVGRRFAAEGAGLAVFGGPAELALCAEVAAGIGPAALDLAGRTPLPVWAAALARCAVVICNDSGGMHLAAAVGTPLVAVYGLTDPARTGPLGRRCTIVQDSAQRARDIARDSQAAQNALAAIAPARVYEAARAWLG